MKKKILIVPIMFIVTMLISLFLVCGLSVVKADESTEGEVEEPTTTTVAECTVVITADKYCDYIIDKEEGNVGDIVSVYPKAYSFFKIDSVTANGTTLVADESGTYKFALVAGENKIVITTAIAQDEINYIVSLVQSAANGENIFTLKNLSTIINWALTALFGTGFCITLLKMKKIKNDTTNDISTKVIEAINSEKNQSVKQYLTEILTPVFEKFGISIKEIDDRCAKMARCMVLAQEDTPEARLAIIQELSEENKDSQELTEEVKKIVTEQLEAKEQEQAATMATLNDLEAKNEAIGAETKEDDSTTNSEGRY